MVSQERSLKIARRIREELAVQLLFHVTDPRLHGVTVTQVRVDKELAFANIFVSCLEGSIREPEIMEGLNSAAGYLRRQLVNQIPLRSFPRLRFRWDPAPEHADHMDRLFQQIRDENPTDEEEGTND